jgi:hypothetical protein
MSEFVLSSQNLWSAEIVPKASIIEVISNPERYQDKRLLVSGYVHIKFESRGIYLCREHYLHAITKNALWLSFDKAAWEGKKVDKINDKWVTLEGVYNGKNKGHLDLFSGSLEHITRIIILDVSKRERLKNVRRIIEK